MKKLIALFLLSFAAVMADSLTVVVGEPVTFSVTNDGTAPFSYQWSYMPAGGNAITIAGATASSYRLPSAKLGDTGNYFVTVSNSAGLIVSDIATLTVKTTVIPPTKATTKSTKI